jgi:hypothetical protein
MSRFYEVDPDADALIILTGAPNDKGAKASKLTNGVNGVNGVNGANGVNGHHHEDEESQELQYDPSAWHIKVSAKHLSLASPFFQAKILANKADAQTAPEGRIPIPLAGFDVAAVKILADIIHGRGPRVPRTLDLQTVAHMAQLVQATSTYGAVEAYADRWIRALEKSVDGDYGSVGEEDLARWIFVASAFQQPALFRKATRAVIAGSMGPIGTADLPIPGHVISEFPSLGSSSWRILSLLPPPSNLGGVGHPLAHEAWS